MNKQLQQINLEFKTTHDGSKTLYRPDINETYHSIHGAVQESLHVFIKMGLIAQFTQQENIFNQRPMNILEVGFGTGLNAWLTFFEKPKSIKINYSSIEKFPINEKIIQKLNYAEISDYPNGKSIFESLHKAKWNKQLEISSAYNLHKIHGDVDELNLPDNHFDVVFFDAFAPNKQPELWELAVFEKMFKTMLNGGVLVTYCAKGEVRRTLIKAGFQVDKLPGPPGKREMLKATKICI